MTDTLFIGDRTYSSWSLRAWLCFDGFGLGVGTQMVPFSADISVADQIAHLAPARTVPVLVTADGAIIPDSLAIAEEVATRYPEAGLWPSDPALRALARSLAAEMHSSFAALRNACPMDLRRAYTGVTPTPEVRADLARIEVLWIHALARSGGPWLCGAYSVADAFFAPVGGRIAGYGLSVGETAASYVAQHLADPAFRRWRAMALVSGEDLPWYAQSYATTPWPGPAPRPARAVKAGPSENAACPYSGKPVTRYLEMDGRVYGVCNAFCRDKTVADPEAWPEFMALIDD
ncbi:MAG: glutathione S-transferase [Pseudomonadota bacterium]